MKYKLLNQEEAMSLRNDIYNTQKHHLFIKYFAEDGECFPLEISPVHLPINDYNIGFSTQKNVITYIINKQLNTEVQFKDMTVNALQGYVRGTVLDIWSLVIDHETLNLLHIHVNDTSDYVSFDSAYVHEGEKLSQFTSFGNDITGKPLKYKILVKDCMVWKVLYNEEQT